MNPEYIYRQMPSKYKERIELQAKYAAIEEYEMLTLKVGAAALILTIAITFFLPYSNILKIGIGILLTAISIPGAPYLYFSIKAERRKSEMEQILPDALNLVAANMKSGHTIEKAFLLSARDEFGPLAEELRKTAMQMYGGTDVQKALKNMENRVKSDLFQETIKLLVDGIEAGGNTADLLQSSSDDIRSSLEIRDEIKSNIRMYMVFIVMAAVLGAPILFAISFYMAKTTTSMWSDTGVGSQTQSSTSQLDIGFSLQFQSPQVNIAFFETFAFLAIMMTNTFSALIISEIRNGNVKQGVKYIPIFIAVSILLFIAVKAGLGSALSGISG